MKNILLLLQIILLVGCKNSVKGTQIENNNIDLVSDSISRDSGIVNYQSITNDFKTKYDYVNPFDTLSIKYHFPICEKNDTIFSCFIDNLNVVSPPLSFGPHHEPKWDVLDCINDSIYESIIKTSLNNLSYLNTQHGDRTYCYYGGFLIDKSNNYSLILMLFDYSAGYEYILFTLNKDGQYIDKIVIGAMDSDSSETFGMLADKKHGEILFNLFGYDEIKDKIFIENQERYRFSIKTDGKIIKIKK
jgi:hypothetical protein